MTILERAGFADVGVSTWRGAPSIGRSLTARWFQHQTRGEIRLDARVHIVTGTRR